MGEILKQTVGIIWITTKEIFYTILTVAFAVVVMPLLFIAMVPAIALVVGEYLKDLIITVYLKIKERLLEWVY